MLCGWTHIDIIIGFAADLSCTSLAGGWMLDAVRLLSPGTQIYENHRGRNSGPF
jgi:hypothetical protein